MPPSPFCAIVADPHAAHVVLDDDVCIAPRSRAAVSRTRARDSTSARRHLAGFRDEAQIGPFFQRVQRIARMMPNAVKAQGTFIAADNVVSQSVAHFHVHVVPRETAVTLRSALHADVPTR